MLKLATVYLTSAAATVTAPVAVTTIDDFQERRIKHIYCGTIAAGFALVVFLAGQQIANIDTTRYANGNEPVDLEFTVPAKIQLSFGFTDLAATQRTNVPIVITYEADR